MLTKQFLKSKYRWQSKENNLMMVEFKWLVTVIAAVSFWGIIFRK